MSIHQHATLEDTVYFWFASNDTSGSGDDGATPLCDVRLAGATISDAPILSPTPALISNAAYPAGCYEVAVAATAGNGFAATNTYAVFCSITVDSQNPTGFVGSFTLDPIRANVIEISDDATAATNAESFFDGTGYAGTNNVIPTVTALTGHTAQTADHTANIAAIVADTNELQTDDVPGLIAALNNVSTAQVNAEVDTALSDYDPPTKAELDSGLAGLNDPTAASIADAVWDEAATGHTDAGKAGEQQWTDIDAILADTGELQTNQGAWATAVGFSTHSAADVRTEMDANSTQLAAIVADTNELQTDDVPGLIAALNNVAVADILTTQMTEAYAADGTAPTLAQALFLIQQSIGDFSISGTTLTVKKLDGSTAAATYSLDDDSNPTSRTRSS